ncbi:MAG: hypothetical protein KDD45_06230 [Bdellovibrionales bacterium]|nr:hypothetical protein [Bdellovibrionales bacterium]
MKIAIFFYILLIGYFSNATLYPINLDKNTEVLVIDNPVDDEVIRLDILSRAQHSIDIIAHTQTSGEFGLKVINTLRDRMNNGVRLRYLYEKIASMGVGETSDRGIRLLSDANLYTTTNSQLIVSRPLEKIKSPFTVTDLLHEKMIIVDRGTPNEIIMIGGRNHDEFSVTSADFTFVLRRVNASKGYIGDSLQEHFNKLFVLASRYFSIEPGRKISPKELKYLQDRSIKLKYKLPSPFVSSVLELLNQPVVLSDTPKSFQFYPEKTRLVTNDLFKVISENKLPKKYLVRDDLLSDDITTYVAGLIENANKLELTSYILSMPKIIKEAIKSMLAEGGKFLSYSNNGLAYGLKLPVKSLGNAVHSMNLGTFFDFTSVAKGSSVSMYSLDPKQGIAQNPGIDYNHRKVALLDIKNRKSVVNGELRQHRIVVSGSYNFTLSSASKNDEMVIMFDDTRMADYITGINHRDAMIYYLELDPVEAKRILKRNKIPSRVCRKFFESLF